MSKLSKFIINATLGLLVIGTLGCHAKVKDESNPKTHRAPILREGRAPILTD